MPSRAEDKCCPVVRKGKEKRDQLNKLISEGFKNVKEEKQKAGFYDEKKPKESGKKGAGDL